MEFLPAHCYAVIGQPIQNCDHSSLCRLSSVFFLDLLTDVADDEEGRRMTIIDSRVPHESSVETLGLERLSVSDGQQQSSKSHSSSKTLRQHGV